MFSACGQNVDNEPERAEGGPEEPIEASVPMINERGETIRAYNDELYAGKEQELNDNYKHLKSLIDETYEENTSD